MKGERTTEDPPLSLAEWDRQAAEVDALVQPLRDAILAAAARREDEAMLRWGRWCAVEGAARIYGVSWNWGLEGSSWTPL